MSKTQFKNASRVWNAMRELSTPTGESLYERQWHRVGEVAKQAGMTKPTVRKYLKMAVEEGQALHVEFAGASEYRIIDNGQ